MIPKIIHYCWLSSDPLPAKLQACIDSWSVHCPDYEVRLWNFDRLGDDCPVWVREAFDNKKYAFASDFVRCYAVYKFGGIYLDSDVELRKSFDSLLDLPYMLGRESDSDTVEAAVVGAPAGHPFFAALLEHYRDRHFVRPDGSFDITPLPKVINSVCRGRFEFVDVDSPDQVTDTPGRLCVLPSDWFSPISLKNMAMNVTGNTVAIHHFAGSWKPASYRGKKRLQKFLGPKVTDAIIRLKDIILNRRPSSTAK